ncbi:MAG TPA: Xaa-Pro peptidase family protein [Tepidisphaeraceae bacterium]|nr:Xaa-Pro peptidase family protein [Tepidisphaeraceae bacterium]
MAKTPSKAQSSTGGAVSLSEFIERRRKVFAALKGAAAVVFSGEGAAPLLGRWRPDASFFYLTGIENEPGAAVLFNPAADITDRKITLFLRPLNPEVDRWDGYREQIGSALKDRTGFATVMRSSALPAVLTAAARRTKRLACLHPFTTYPAPPSADLAVFRSVAERVPGVAIEDMTNLLPSLRAVKSPAELGMMRQAIAATAAGYEAAMPLIRPGANEAHVARAMERTYVDRGASGVAYNSIVGSGLNSTVLHYMDNSQPLAKGDLLVIDSGASFNGYAADVTRTYPVGGTFSAEQREAYEVVLQAQAAAIKAARTGTKMAEVDAAARHVFDKAGYGDAFIHGIGHQLGIEVHDVTPDGPLAPGMVVTIEPGVYFPDRKLGIRIEDDILITAKGNQNLTDMIPKGAREVEEALRG